MKNLPFVEGGWIPSSSDESSGDDIWADTDSDTDSDNDSDNDYDTDLEAGPIGCVIMVRLPDTDYVFTIFGKNIPADDDGEVKQLFFNSKSGKRIYLMYRRGLPKVGRWRTDFERRSESDLAELTFMDENIKIVKFLYNTIFYTSSGKITVVHDHEADLYPRL